MGGDDSRVLQALDIRPPFARLEAFFDAAEKCFVRV